VRVFRTTRQLGGCSRVRRRREARARWVQRDVWRGRRAGRGLLLWPGVVLVVSIYEIVIELA
jgi:hypothetical protein